MKKKFKKDLPHDIYLNISGAKAWANSPKSKWSDMPLNLSPETLCSSVRGVTELIYFSRQEMGVQAASQAFGAGLGGGQDLAKAGQ